MKRAIYKMMFLLVVVEALFLSNFAYGHEDMCRKTEFNQHLQDRVFKGHVFKTILVDEEELCRLNCYLENDCISYNFASSLVNNKHLCELSDSDHRQHREDLQPENGFVYGASKENQCSKEPCPPNSNCQNVFGGKGYHCQCHTGFTGKACDQMWVKLNTIPVCFGARDNKYGVFSIPQDGHIGALKLVHLSGNLFCYGGSPPSYWGCKSSYYVDKTLMTFISHPNQRSILLPRPRLTQMAGPWGGCNKDFTYKLDGFNDVSPEIIFNTTSDPLQVALNQQFWIWFGQDMADCSESNNGGEICVDVVGWYM